MTCEDLDLFAATSAELNKYVKAHSQRGNNVPDEIISHNLGKVSSRFILSPRQFLPLQASYLPI